MWEKRWASGPSWDLGKTLSSRLIMRGGKNVGLAAVLKYGFFLKVSENHKLLLVNLSQESSSTS
jgi:hypothetical protein